MYDIYYMYSAAQCDGYRLLVVSNAVLTCHRLPVVHYVQL